MANQYRVLRHFRVAGAMRKPSDLLNAADVKNADTLIAQRYLVSADADTASSNLGGPTPDPKIAQDRMVEQAAGRQGGPEDDVADDSPVGGGITEEEGKKLRGKLPDEFPGRAELEAEGLDTYAKVRGSLDTVEDIPGIGPATAEKIRKAFGLASTVNDAGSEVGGGEPGDSTVPKAPNV